MNRVRVTAGLALVLGLVVWTALDVWPVLNLWRDNPAGLRTDVTWFEDACPRIRSQLPLRGPIGYRDRVKDGFAMRRYALVQYALVPIRVEWETDRAPAVEVLGGGMRVVRAGGP